MDRLAWTPRLRLVLAMGQQADIAMVRLWRLVSGERAG